MYSTPHSKLQIHDSFLLLLSVLLLTDEKGAAWCVLCAAALHEMAHYLVLRLCGGELITLTLSFTGGVMRYRLAEHRGKRALIAAAGPCCNFIIAFLLADGIGQYLFAGANLVLGLFNLLPIFPLDGYTILQMGLPQSFSMQILQFFSALCAILLCILGVWLWNQNGGIWLILIGLLLLIQQGTCHLR